VGKLNNIIMNLKNIFSIFLITLFFSCENNEQIINADNLLLGAWIEPEYDSGTITYKRGNSLPDNNPGILFSENGDFIERSSGWCGTPPLIYADYNGSFEIDETLIKISTTFYPNSYQWRVISLTEDELVVKIELTEQETEHRNLMNLFDEIQNLAYAISCVDAGNWAFTAYGSKACGGPQGYIAYSSKINTIELLEKIDFYTKAEKEFNIKWGIISDCSIVNQPKAIVCNNGFATLTY
jgi:hypothetical protein